MGPESPIGLRASDADREAAVGRLRIAAMEGRLDADELAQRVTVAYQAKWCQELDRLTADVTAPAVGVPQPGPPVAPVFVRSTTRTNPLAIASLVLGFAWMAWLGSVGAVVLGHMALRQIRESHGTQSGKGLAIAGIVMGYFWMLVLVLALLDGAVG